MCYPECNGFHAATRGERQGNVSEPKPSLVQSEPALVAGGAAGVVALVMAGLIMLNSLGVLTLTPEQLDAIKSFLIPLVAVLGPVVVALFVRPRVTPTAKLYSGETVQTADGQSAVLVPAAQAQMMGIVPLGEK